MQNLDNNNNHMNITFTLNGNKMTITIDPVDRLLDVLRCQLKMTGTKEGCGEGECGACTVIQNGLPVNSCLIPAYQIHNHNIETIESINDKILLNNMQNQGATQCGACSPGIVMTTKWLCQNQNLLSENNNNKNAHEIRKILAGNLCRCTGYESIINGIIPNIKNNNYNKNNPNNQ